MFPLIILDMIAQGFIDALTGDLTEELWTKLRGDSAQRALKQALGAAIQRYATTGSRLDLARPLLQKDGPLTDPVVTKELAQVVRFIRPPNVELIGQRWKNTLEDPPQWRDFTYEAKILVDYFESELRGTEMFRPIFNTKSLETIAAAQSSSVETLVNIELQLTSLVDLMASHFDDLTRIFAGARLTIRDDIHDFSRYIAEKTRAFVGRQFVFDAIQKFVDANPRGYFFVHGDPGVGKSALAAQLVKVNGYEHYFNIQAEGINNAEMFIKSICAQLIAVYGLEHGSVPSRATQSAFFLKQLLDEVSNKLDPGKKAIIVVDALDEVDNGGLSQGANTLYLPTTLPQSVYFVITMRKETVNLRIDCEQSTLYLQQDSKDNVADIRKFVEQSLDLTGIQSYKSTQGIDDELFVEHLVRKSEGNFMYLRYVLPEIESGAYQDLALESIPVGLQSYYEDHWRRMGMTALPLPRAKIKIVYILVEIRRPVSRQLVSSLANEDDLTVQEVLDEWGQFLHKQIEDGQNRYSVYHLSFRDFLHRKDIVQAANVTIEGINAVIADALWQSLSNDELFKGIDG